MTQSKINFRFIVFIFVALAFLNGTESNKKNKAHLVYVDPSGVLRYTRNDQEAAFFGVNYTTPFAYAYRAHKALNVDLEKAISDDVYHLSRLGLDAFRVHVWDTEISDSLGNLLENDHLRLFDYLIAELKKRNIKTIVTPIAFWGNGYPQRDEKTPGFSRVFGRGKLTTDDQAIRAQEKYMQQFFQHVNPYTKLTYTNDPDIIAVEINNEPSHSGTKAGVTSYINRLAAAVKSVGWTKPVFYNISQGPFWADAVAASDVDGFSFQWYPAGLVSGQTIKGNYLPFVDRYTIPFDTIPAFAKKALMVYEFDAADVWQSNVYPAMARSFRGAGFQWATQFAYDPMALAHANTEYQTHYLNLAYTPSKAISMMIASEVFHSVPRGKSFGAYPADTVFQNFRLSYKESLSELNSAEKFYYSNATNSKPFRPEFLKHIAGVGNSSMVKYAGTGAYFLDKIEDGAWRLEVMPDAIFIRDPFERASPKKEVTRIQWKEEEMELFIADLGQAIHATGLNKGNTFNEDLSGVFKISPGTYLLVKKGKKLTADKKVSDDFAAPKPFDTSIELRHDPYPEVTMGKAFTIRATIAGIESGEATLQISRMGAFGQPKSIKMVQGPTGQYSAEVPADIVAPGVLNYRIIILQAGQYTVFPGNLKGDPFDWSTYTYETWKTLVASENGGLEAYSATTDRSARVYPPFRRNVQSGTVTSSKPGRLVLRVAATELSGDHTLGFQFYFGDKLKGRESELKSFDRIFVRARTAGEPVKCKVSLVNRNAAAISSVITLTSEFREIEIPLSAFAPGSELLLPRPFPGFLPLTFQVPGSTGPFDLKEFEKVEMTIGSDVTADGFKKPYSMEVESIWFEKGKTSGSN